MQSSAPTNIKKILELKTTQNQNSPCGGDQAVWVHSSSEQSELSASMSMEERRPWPTGQGAGLRPQYKLGPLKGCSIREREE